MFHQTILEVHQNVAGVHVILAADLKTGIFFLIPQTIIGRKFPCKNDKMQKINYILQGQEISWNWQPYMMITRRHAEFTQM